MNFFPQPGAALPDSPKLSAKQGHAKSAKAATHNSKPHSRFLTFVHSHIWIPFRPLRPLRAKARPGNAGREQSVPKSPPPIQNSKSKIRALASLPRTPVGALRPLREISGFTLIELMAATTVLSVILLMMVGMQDQMSRAWSNANRRTDATREARAACRLMAEDLSCLVFRPLAFDNQAAYATGLENQGIPFLYSSNGIGPITIPNNQPSASYFFGISARKPAGTGPGDLAIVGYYIASKLTTNVSGFVTTNYNLYRHYVPASNAVSKLTSWFANKTAVSLFSGVDPATDDILARNTCNLRITFYNRQDGLTKGLGNKVTNGLNYQCVSAGNSSYYSGSKIQAEISVYPEDLAQKLVYTTWGNSTNIQKYARSYEFRVDVPRD